MIPELIWFRKNQHLRGLGRQRAEGKSNNKRGEETARRVRRAERQMESEGKKWRRNPEERIEKEMIIRRQTDRSELSNLVFPKVPDISLHHKLVLPPKQAAY